MAFEFFLSVPSTRENVILVYTIGIGQLLIKFTMIKFKCGVNVCFADNNYAEINTLCHIIDISSILSENIYISDAKS